MMSKDVGQVFIAAEARNVTIEPQPVVIVSALSMKRCNIDVLRLLKLKADLPRGNGARFKQDCASLSLGVGQGVVWRGRRLQGNGILLYARSAGPSAIAEPYAEKG
jgi:hypothetical protein